MGTFAETADVDYRLSFVDQRKQTSVCRKQTETYLRFPYTVPIQYIETVAYI
jgi:hypothetical protein